MPRARFHRGDKWRKHVNFVGSLQILSRASEKDAQNVAAHEKFHRKLLFSFPHSTFLGARSTSHRSAAKRLFGDEQTFGRFKIGRRKFHERARRMRQKWIQRASSRHSKWLARHCKR